MSAFSLKDAAKLVGISRPTIYRMVSEGKLSVTQDERGVRKVDAAELLRVFPAARLDTVEIVRPVSDAVPERQDETAATKLLEAELRAAREVLEITREALHAEREDKARLLGVLESQTRLLEDKRPQAPAPSSTTNGGLVWFIGGAAAALVLAVLFYMTRL